MAAVHHSGGCYTLVMAENLWPCGDDALSSLKSDHQRGGVITSEHPITAVLQFAISSVKTAGKKTWWTEHVLFWLCLPAAGETSHFTCDNRDHKMVFHISVYLFVCFLELQLTIIFIIYFISSVWFKFYCSETDNSLIINKRSLKFVWGFRPTVELHHFEHNMNNFKNSEQLFRLKLKPETWVMFVKSATIFRGAAVNTLQYFTFPS